MSVLFNTIFPGEIKIPPVHIRQLIDSYHARQRTGLVRLGYSAEKQLYFLFKRGNILNVYLVTPETWEGMTPEQGVDWMASAGEAHAKSVAISSFGLLMTKLLLQSHNRTENMAVKRNDLLEYLERLHEKNDVTLLHLEWTDATGMVFFERNANSHFHFASKDAFLEERGGLKILSEWDEPQCNLTMLSPDLGVEAWQEYYMRRVFTKICEEQLNRFEKLAGRTLVDSLVRLVVVFASHQGLDISITSKKLDDHEVFSSPQAAAQNYNLLLGEIFKHFSAVIGPRLHTGMLKEITKSLPLRERQILHQFELLPQGYLHE